MPVYDFECQKCGYISEAITDIHQRRIVCPECKNIACRIISASGQYCSNEDAEWLKSVREVVGNETREGRAFLKDPTRANYKAWMQRKGLRPLEPGEKPQKPAPFNLETLHKEVARRHFERKSINIR